MNKIIKNYIEEADYHELLDIMECAHNSMLKLIAEKENTMDWLMSTVIMTSDYINRLHLVPTPLEQHHCNCTNNNYE